MMQLIEKKSEWKIVLVIALFLSIASIVPFLAGYFAAGDRIYISVENIPDGYTYLGYLKSNMEENILISQNFTTSEDQIPTLPNMYFAAVAIISKLTTIPMEIVFVGLKTLLLIPFVFILWRFLHDYFPTAKQRLVSFFCKPSDCSRVWR